MVALQFILALASLYLVFMLFILALVLQPVFFKKPYTLLDQLEAESRLAGWFVRTTPGVLLWAAAGGTLWWIS